MKLRLILLNVVLVAAIAVSLWQARARWQDAQAVRRATVDVPVPHIAPPPVSPLPHPEAPDAVKYVDVATKDLFSRDRNPTVIIDAPVVEKPKEMPSLPVVYGVLGLPSGTRALMAEKAGLASKSVRVGDTIGEFAIASLDSRTVAFLWAGKRIERKIEDLMDRSDHGAAGAGQPGGAPPLPSAMPGGMPAPPQQQNQQTNNAPPPPPPASGSMGPEIGTPQHPERACRPGENSPAGTVMDGYRKSLNATPFGTLCRWTPVP